MNLLYNIILFAPPILLAVILHEIAHGYVAEKLGDPTARSMGRITLNPIVHIDLFMTIILPGLFILSNSPVVFGGAKPVPVNPMYFKNPRRGMAIVALAGPLTNFTLALIFYLLFEIVKYFQILESIPESIPPALAVIPFLWLLKSILINVVLGIFNLLPIPPLDGGRIVVGFLPIRIARIWAKLEPFGLVILFLLLYLGVVDWLLEPVFRITAQKLLGG